MGVGPELTSRTCSEGPAASTLLCPIPRVARQKSTFLGTPVPLQPLSVAWPE